MTLDRLTELEKAAHDPGGVKAALEYQEALIASGPALIAVAQATQTFLNAPNKVRVQHAGAVGRTERAIAEEQLIDAFARLDGEDA
jgi:hypothetical protein